MVTGPKRLPVVRCLSELMPQNLKKLLSVLCLGVLFTVASAAHAQTDDASAMAVALFQKGQDAHEKGDLNSAIDFYTKALELLPEFPEAELQRGNAFMSLGKFADAERSYRRSIDLREDWSLAMSSLGSLLVTEKKFDEAAGLLNRSLELDAMNPLALSAMADLLIETGASTETLRAYLGRLQEFAGKVRPTAGVLASKAALEERLGDRAAARESASRALQMDSNSRAALVLLADFALAENDVEKADGFVTRLESISPKSPESVIQRARVLFARGKKAEALTSLEAMQSPSESVKAMIAKIKEGDVADLAGLEAKARRTPNDVNALSKLCVGFRVLNPGKALEYCRRASILEPNEVSHAVNFGAALVQAKRFEEAVGLFRKLLTIQPEHATARANLATALYQLKRFPEAKTEFAWLTEKQPGSAAAFLFLAIIHDQLQEYFDAMANYQQFLKLADPEANKLDIEKVNLRLPPLQKQIKAGKGKKTR
jgi:tetratricopeptide (TPR) repeat protein